MSAETFKIVELLKERILAMNELAESLSRAGAAIVACDIDGLEAGITRQQNLCAQICGIDARLEAMQKRHESRSEKPLSPPALHAKETPEEKALRQAMSRLQDVHLRVKSLNATHAVLLQRSRRTIRALAHVYQSVATELYVNPAAPCAAVGENV